MSPNVSSDVVSSKSCLFVLMYVDSESLVAILLQLQQGVGGPVESDEMVG